MSTQSDLETSVQVQESDPFSNDANPILDNLFNRDLVAPLASALMGFRFNKYAKPPDYDVTVDQWSDIIAMVLPFLHILRLLYALF